MPPPPTAHQAARSLPCVPPRHLSLGGLSVGALRLWAAALCPISLLHAPAPAAVAARRFAFAPPIVLALVLGTASFLQNRRIKALAVQTEYRLCPNCCYDLRGTTPIPDEPNRISCPECGQSIHAAESEQLWRAFAA